MLAERYGWTPEQVDALDRGYYTHLLAFLNAKDTVEARRQKRAASSKPAASQGAKGRSA